MRAWTESELIYKSPYAIKMRILSLFNSIYDIVKDLVHQKSSIKEIKRGFIDASGKEFYTDYFTAPHSQLREIAGMPEGVPVFDFLLNDGNHLFLTYKYPGFKMTKKLFYLDDLRELLPSYSLGQFEKNLQEIHLLEGQYFSKLGGVKKAVEHNLGVTLTLEG